GANLTSDYFHFPSVPPVAQMALYEIAAHSSGRECAFDLSFSRENHGDGCANTYSALKLHTSTMKFHELLRQRKSESYTFVFPRQLTVYLSETLEGSGDILLRNSNTCIRDGNGQLASASEGRDGHAALRRREFDCVGKKIDECLPDTPPISSN